MELKAKIINTADLLMDLLECCRDEEFVDEIVNAIYCNDKEPLWTWEDKLSVMAEEGSEEEEY